MPKARFAPLAFVPIVMLGASCQTNTVACQQNSDCFLNERCSGGFCEARPQTTEDVGEDTTPDADTGEQLPSPPDLATICPSSQRPDDSDSYVPTAIALAPTHACVIDVSRRLHCWGKNERGQLGNDSFDPAYLPTSIGEPCGWSRVAVGGQTTCAITVDDQLFCWGDNRFGQLGLGDFETRSLPYQIPGEWAAVVVGPDRVCARDSSDDTWCWGNNGTRRNLLGAEDLSQREASPVKIIEDFYALEITLGDAHTCVVRRSDRQLFCWGDNQQSQIGPELGRAGSPIPFFTMRNFIWQHVSAGGGHTCGILRGSNDRNIYCWGDDAAPYGLVAPDSEEAPHYIGSDGHFGWTIFTSETHTCSIDFRLDNATYGGLLCWGDNASGQVSPQDSALVMSSPRLVNLPDNDVFSAAVTENVSCALSGDPPQLRCWGSNEHGHLATGDTETRQGVISISLQPR